MDTSVSSKSSSIELSIDDVMNKKPPFDNPYFVEEVLYCIDDIKWLTSEMKGLTYDIERSTKHIQNSSCTKFSHSLLHNSYNFNEYLKDILYYLKCSSYYVDQFIDNDLK